MDPLVREAINIANDLGEIIVVGAVAVMIHTQRGRQSADIDIAISTDLSNDELILKKYIPIRDKRDSWDSPRGVKIDIFRRDVSGIPIETVDSTAKNIIVDKKGTTVKTASLEVLTVAKYRALNSRKSLGDESDLRVIAKRKFKEIDWKSLSKITTETEFADIKRVLTTYYNS